MSDEDESGLAQVPIVGASQCRRGMWKLRVGVILRGVSFLFLFFLILRYNTITAKKGNEKENLPLPSLS